MSLFRYIIIPLNQATGRSSNEENNILKQLEEAEIKVAKYKQVAAYYNLN